MSRISTPYALSHVILPNKKIQKNRNSHLERNDLENLIFAVDQLIDKKSLHAGIQSRRARAWLPA